MIPVLDFETLDLGVMIPTHTSVGQMAVRNTAHALLSPEIVSQCISFRNYALFEIINNGNKSSTMKPIIMTPKEKQPHAPTKHASISRQFSPKFDFH